MEKAVGFQFPEAIVGLPEADIPFEGCIAYLIQGEAEQVLFMRFEKEVELVEHSHNAQWAIVLAGEIALTIGGEHKEYVKGDTYYIPEGVKHSGRIYAGYSDMTYFAQKDRYKRKE